MWVRLFFLVARLAFRYSYFRVEHSSGGFLSTLAVLAVAIGVSILVVVLSIINGFESTVSKHALGVSSHALAFLTESAQVDVQKTVRFLEKEQRVVSASPYIRLDGMAFNSDRTVGVILEAIDLEKDGVRLLQKKYIKQSHVRDLADRTSTVLLGHSLASRLKVGKGDKVTVAVPHAGQKAELSSPIYIQLEVAGTFRIGMNQYDNRVMLTSINTARSYFGPDTQVSGLRLTFDDPALAPSETAKMLQKTPALASAIDWTEYHKIFFESLKSQKRMMLIVLGLIIAVAAFNVASNISVTIFDRNKDIGLFIALGMTRANIMTIFLIQALFIAMTGVILGAIIGICVSTQVTDIVRIIEGLVGFKLINPEIYFIDHLPAEFRWNDLLTIVVVTLGVSLAAAYYPAHRASKMTPLELKRQN